MLNDLSWAAAHDALASWDIQAQEIEPLTLTETSFSRLRMAQDSLLFFAYTGLVIII